MSSNAPTTVSAGGYLVLKPVLNTSGQVKAMRIDRVTQMLPQHLGNGERPFYITVTVPKNVFHPLPGVSIVVPESDIVVPEVELSLS